MLRLVRLVDRWHEIQRGLPERWTEARLRLEVDDSRARNRAAAVLAPAGAGRSGDVILFTVTRGGEGGALPEAIRRLLRRLDAEGVVGELALVDVLAGAAPPADGDWPRNGNRTLVETWDAALAELPADWSDVLAEVELRSTDHLERGALLMAPLNPLRDGARPALRFRAAQRYGYGAWPGMVRRCLERCDGERMVGTVRVLWALSDTDPVQTQGPVWYVGGRVL
jgi:hypothetical protein